MKRVVMLTILTTSIQMFSMNKQGAYIEKFRVKILLEVNLKHTGNIDSINIKESTGYLELDAQIVEKVKKDIFCKNKEQKETFVENVTFISEQIFSVTADMLR